MPTFNPGDQVVPIEYTPWHQRNGIKPGMIGTVVKPTNWYGGILVTYPGADLSPAVTSNPTNLRLVSDNDALRHRAKLAEKRGHLILE